MTNFYRKTKISTTLGIKKQNRSSLDRRAGEDRRKAYHIDFFDIVGYDRRKFKVERREVLEEKRDNWVRVTKWSSVCVNSKGLHY